MNTTPFMTRNGIIHLEALPEKVLTAHDLGETLAKINRFSGGTRKPWPVAAHSVLVSRLCGQKEEQVWGLLHDAHEAFIGDITSPAVTFIASQSLPVAGNIVGNCVTQAKAALDHQIARAWCVSTVTKEEIVHYDRIALDVEMFVFFGAPLAETTEDHERAIDIIRGLPCSDDWRVAARLWTSEAERLAHLGACHLPNPHNQPGRMRP